MYKGFKLIDSFDKDNYNLNHYGYLQQGGVIVEECLAKFVIKNVLDGFTKYNLNEKIGVKNLKKIIETRWQHYNQITSGYLGVDSEVFFVGFLNENLVHKVITRNNSLEAADVGMDILSLDDLTINVSEVKSSLTDNAGINRKKIVEAIYSIICRVSKVGDQNEEILKTIVDVDDFSDSEILKIKQYIEKSLDEKNASYEEFVLKEYINENIKINLLLLTKKDLDIDDIGEDIKSLYISTYCKKNKKGSIVYCPRFEDCEMKKIESMFKHIYAVSTINTDHMLLSENFSNKIYYEKLIEEVKAYE